MTSITITRLSIIAILLLSFTLTLQAQTVQPKATLFENVQVFDSKNKKLSSARFVLVVGDKIAQLSNSPIVVGQEVHRIDGKGKTLIPGLIDAHVHLVFGSLTMMEMMNPKLDESTIMAKAGIQAERMLKRGFTSVRDVGGPIFPIKAAIDRGDIPGPRVWPAGPVISQTAGHGDFRTPDERSRRFFGPISRAEIYGATYIADGRDDVLTAVRENLRGGAAFIKLMAGGGTSSAYDPVDVTQYTLDEMKAAVEAAEDWGTYVTVHAYTPRAIQRAITAGVKCVEHGQMLDKKTLKLMAKKKVWLSLQTLMESTPDMDPQRVEKRKPVIEGQPFVWAMALKYKVPIAWGTDFLFEPELNELQNKFIVKLTQWMTPAEIIQLLTYNNAQVLALSGLRSPYKGTFGVIEPGAMADLILLDGNPLSDITILTRPSEKFTIIMQGGKLVQDLTTIK